MDNESISSDDVSTYSNTGGIYSLKADDIPILDKPVMSKSNLEFDRKIKDNVIPTVEDIRELKTNISNLNKAQQLQIFHTAIKHLTVYTATTSAVFFSLDALTPAEFWNLNYHVQMITDCIEYDKAMVEFQRKCNEINSPYNGSHTMSVNDCVSSVVENITGGDYKTKVLHRNIYTDKKSKEKIKGKDKKT